MTLPTFTSTESALDFAERATPEEIEAIGKRLDENEKRYRALRDCLDHASTIVGRTEIVGRIYSVAFAIQFDHECLNHAQVAA